MQDSNRINDDDGSLEVVHALSDEAKRIRGWLEPSDDQLAEMFAEAGVPNRPIPGTKEYDEETELMQEAADALRYYTHDKPNAPHQPRSL